VRDPAYAVVAALPPDTGVLAELVPRVAMLPSYADALEALKAAVAQAPADAGRLRVLAHEDLPQEAVS